MKEQETKSIVVHGEAACSSELVFCQSWLWTVRRAKTCVLHMHECNHTKAKWGDGGITLASGTSAGSLCHCQMNRFEKKIIASINTASFITFSCWSLFLVHWFPWSLKSLVSLTLLSFLMYFEFLNQVLPLAASSPVWKGWAVWAALHTAVLSTMAPCHCSLLHSLVLWYLSCHWGT